MNIRRLLCVAIVVCVTLSLVSMVPATTPLPPIASHVIFAQKPNAGENPSDWSVWNFTMWGQLDYYTPWPTFDYAFDGHGLAPSTAYTLLYYPDPWPGNNLICIDHGTTNATGGIILHGSTNIGALPKAYDANINAGAKIWLVLSTDVDCVGKKMIAWQPTLYLFELWLIQYETALPTTTIISTITSPTTILSTVTSPTTTTQTTGSPATTTATITLPQTTITVPGATSTITQTVTMQQSTCPTCPVTTTTTHTTYTSTTSTTTRTTTTNPPPCRQRICKLHYAPLRGKGVPYDVVVPCDSWFYGCSVYTDAKGQTWQVCRTITYPPGTGPICPINDC